MNTSLFVFFLCLVSWAFSSGAVEVDDLYQSSVTIDNQGRQARLRSQREALKKVLVKVSGTSAVLQNTEIKKAVRNAGLYLRRFQYIHDDDNQLKMLADFDEAKVNKLLRREALPIWGKRRPSILLWMAGQDPDSGIRRVVSKESYHQQMNQIVEASADRGVPMVIPLYDLVDNQEVLVSDVWGYFYQHIQKFSLRYNTDAIAIARFKQIEQSPDMMANEQFSPTDPTPKWQLQWRLYEADDKVDANAHEGDLDTIINQFVNKIADKYAEQYAVDSSKVDGGSRLILTVTNVSALENLINAEQLLLSFSAVSDVMLKTFKGDTAEFEILLLGESLDLLQGLELEKHFEKIFDPLADTQQQQPLKFRWNP